MKGLIYSAPMVLAILEGHKDITRRPMNPQPVMENGIWRWRPRKKIDIDLLLFEAFEQTKDFAPYKVGETVYVKETWRTTSNFDSRPPRDLPKGVRIWYEADWMQKVDYIDQAAFNDCGKLRSSMFMPECLARLHLKVLSVRAERLQGIKLNYEDLKREGFDPKTMMNWDRSWYWYIDLWDSIYGPGSWASNPWVWVYEMQKVESRQ